MGTIRERKPGHFEIRAYVGRSPSGSPRYVQETYVHHRKDGGIQAAKNKLKALERKAQNQKSTTTLAALLDDWLAHAKSVGRSPTTLSAYTHRVRFITDALGAIQLGKLSPKDLDAWYGGLIRAGKSPADVMAYHRIISAALNQGEKWDDEIRNVARRASPPRVPEADIEPPSPQRVETLIRLAEESRSPEMAPIIFWSCITGMRRGEICGLHWNRVDWAGSRIYVCRSVWQTNSRVGEKDTKSHQTRWISIEDPTGVGVGLLRARLNRAQADAAEVGVELDPDGYVWSTDLAGREPLHPDRITQAFTRLCQKAEKPARDAAAEAGRELTSDERWPYRLHDLRHYSAVELLDAGVPLNVVQERLGHSKASTTSDIYGHGKKGRDQKTAGIIVKSLTPRKEHSK